MKYGNRRGSTLVMVLIAVLILSLIAISALTQTSTEIGTARNFVLDKRAFFAAEAGIQDGTNRIKNSHMNPSGINFSAIFAGQRYYTGLLTDSTSQNVKAFMGFKPPPPTGQSIEMGGELGMGTAAWDLRVSAGSGVGRNLTRKQLQSVVVTMVAEY